MLLYLLVFTFNCRTISLFIICVILSLSNVRLSETAICIFPSSPSFHLARTFLFFRSLLVHLVESMISVHEISLAVHLILRHRKRNGELFDLNLY